MDTNIIQSQPSSIHISDLNLLAAQPGQLRVIRRNGELTVYEDSRIAVAIKKN